MKRWKVAISLAAVAAVAAPFVFGTWKVKPKSYRLVPLTEQQRQWFGNRAKERNYCRNLDNPNLVDLGCEERYLTPIKEGGTREYYDDPFKYLAFNLVAVIVGYAGVFGLAMVLPTIVRWIRTIVLRYWRWFKT
jgi:hypothetical protein